ncbi:MAG: hypothetical protein MJA82_05820 [Clostridia bacterium]|nr:hypothetical protein [Clostridia bacterium]
MNNKEKVEKLFTRVFFNLIRNHSNTTSFRRLSSIGKPTIISKLQAENSDFAYALFNNPEYEKLFLDQSSTLTYLGGLSGVESSITSNQISTFDMTIDATSIVFMHSALDAAVTDLCYLTAKVSPDDWFKYMKRKKASLEEVKDNIFQKVYIEKLDEHLQKIDRESLTDRTSILFALCKPPANFFIKQSYNFKKSELEKIDNIRHEIVHGTGSLSSIKNVKKKIDYLFYTGLHLWGMVNEKYDVKINQMYMFNTE